MRIRRTQATVQGFDLHPQLQECILCQEEEEGPESTGEGSLLDASCINRGDPNFTLSTIRFPMPATLGKHSPPQPVFSGKAASKCRANDRENAR